MILKEKERAAIEDLQTQEKSCVEKYGKYAKEAKDPELKNLFSRLQKEEQKNYDSLSQVLNGSVPDCDCNDSQGRDYAPKAAYSSMSSNADKEHDAFLATDCIGTEKLVSGLSLERARSENCWPISRSKSRIMRRCCSNTRWQMEWHKEKNTSAKRRGLSDR